MALEKTKENWKLKKNIIKIIISKFSTSSHEFKKIIMAAYHKLNSV